MDLFVENQPIAAICTNLPNKPTLIAMVVLKPEDTVTAAEVFKRSVVVGQLIFDKSIAREREAKEKVNAAIAADTVAPLKPARAPYHQMVKNASDGGPTPIHQNIKTPEKLYICLDQMKGPEKATYYDSEGTEIPTAEAELILSSKKKTGELADVNFRLYSVENIKCFALCPAPEKFEDVPAELAKLAAALEGK